MNHGSLFSGIGGFDLAAEWMGWNNVFHCEKDKHCQKHLKKIWPNAKSYKDIKTTDFSIHRNKLYILSGGDPCQPSSVAGLGKGTADDRYLWPEMFRAAKETESPWIVNECVGGTVSNGILDIKINDLEGIGYSCQPYDIPAEAVGALHQRSRIWLVAYNSDFYRNYQKSLEVLGAKKEQRLEDKRNEVYKFREPVDLWSFGSDTHAERLKKFDISTQSEIFKEGVSGYFGFGTSPYGNIPRDIIESCIMGMLDGLPEGMDYADRSKRIKQTGNAIVPQIAFEIFKAIEQYEHLTP